VSQCSSDPSKVYCSACGKYMRCKKDDIAKHDRGQRHRSNLFYSADHDVAIRTILINEARGDGARRNGPEENGADILDMTAPDALLVQDVDMSLSLREVLESLERKKAVLRGQQGRLLPSGGDCAPLRDRGDVGGALGQVIDAIKLLKDFVVKCR